MGQLADVLPLAFVLVVVGEGGHQGQGHDGAGLFRLHAKGSLSVTVDGGGWERRPPRHAMAEPRLPARQSVAGAVGSLRRQAMPKRRRPESLASPRVYAPRTIAPQCAAAGPERLGD